MEVAGGPSLHPSCEGREQALQQAKEEVAALKAELAAKEVQAAKAALTISEERVGKLGLMVPMGPKHCAPADSTTKKVIYTSGDTLGQTLPRCCWKTLACDGNILDIRRKGVWA